MIDKSKYQREIIWLGNQLEMGEGEGESKEGRGEDWGFKEGEVKRARG